MPEPTEVPAAVRRPWSARELLRRLSQPVDIAVLAYFRVVFGAVMLWEVWRYFDHGWIHRYYIAPEFNFSYMGFGWVQPWPGELMYVHFVVLGVLALFITLGLWYRASALLFSLGFTYVFLLDKANYLNHFYLISLISFLMVLVPAHRAFSLDARRRPALRSATAPSWSVWLLRFQVGIPYFYGGLAKINEDWLRGEPMREWLADRTDYPVLGQFFEEDWMVALFTDGGLLLDLLVVPFLLWRRTRIVAFAAAVLFHLTNAAFFYIGIFPWFMIAATAVFFDPSWPRRLLGRLRGGPRGAEPMVGSAVPLRPALSVFLAVWVAVQVTVPFRHFLYPGNVSWTEEGHRFSWHMKLRTKEVQAMFQVMDPATGERWPIDPSDYLSWRQHRKMVRRPDMILDFSHYIAERLSREGRPGLEVHAYVAASLNRRPIQLLIDPKVDLAAQPRSLAPSPWIVPLEPLRLRGAPDLSVEESPLPAGPSRRR